MPRKRKIIYIALAAFLIWAAGYIAFSAFVLTAEPESPGQTTDAIVVLTGGPNRVETGLTLFAQGKAHHLFITGVHDHVSKNDILNRWAGETALPPCCVTIDRHAASTLQNARETREWIKNHDYSAIRLVTSNYHMTRAYSDFKHALPGVTILMHPVKSYESTNRHKSFWRILFVEYHKTLFRWGALMITPRKPLIRSLET